MVASRIIISCHSISVPTTFHILYIERSDHKLSMKILFFEVPFRLFQDQILLSQKMGSQGLVTTSAISYILVLVMLVGTARSDFQQDRTECADQLVGLATCLPYVGGDAKTPT